MPKRTKFRIRDQTPILPLVLVLSACSHESSESPGSEVRLGTNTWFEEVAAQSGLDFQYQTGHSGQYLMPEIKGGGVGLLDYDADGLLDVFCVQAGALDPAKTQRLTHRLFRNLGNWRFQDVTATAGVAGDGRYGMGCACADYDGDGRCRYPHHARSRQSALPE